MTTVKFGRVVHLAKEKADPGVPFSIGLDAIEAGTGRLASEPMTDYEGGGIAFKPGDLLFGKLRPYLAKAWLADRDGSAVGDFHVYRPTDRVHPAYLRWVLLARNFLDAVASSVFGAKMPRADWAFIRNIEIYVPQTDEQRAIADYLDRETARIDTLIKEQQRLIEILRERRQAVIDASFSTFGEFTVKLRRYIKFLTSGSRGWGDYYADHGERFLRIGNLPRSNLEIRGGIQFVELPPDVTEGSRTMLQEGDLLFSITAYLGSVAVVEEDWVGAYVSQHVALCRLESERVNPRFIGWFMLTTTGQDQLNKGAAGGTKMQLALDDIKELRAPTAPWEQQRRIAAHLDRQTAKVDDLVAESERFIELARERRSALITAAVTGQIDVRELA